MSSSQLTVRGVRSCGPAESLFPVREMVKDISDLPPRIEQRMFVGKSMKLHPPTQNGHGTPLIRINLCKPPKGYCLSGHSLRRIKNDLHRFSTNEFLLLNL